MEIFSRNLTEPKEELVMPLAPLREGVVFPSVETILNFGRPKSIAAVQSAFKSNKLLCLFTQKDPHVLDPHESDLYRIGVLAKVSRLTQVESGLQAWIKGIERVELVSVEAGEPYLAAKINHLKKTMTEYDDETRVLAKVVMENFQKSINMGKAVDVLTIMHLMGENNPETLSDRIAYTLELETDSKQKLLEVSDLKVKLKAINDYLGKEISVLELERSISDKTQKRFDKSMREALLRERKKTIEEELGELAPDEDSDIKELGKKIAQAKLPKEAKKKAQTELRRLSRLNVNHPEYGYIRTYLDWLVEMPWNKSTPNKVSIAKAAKVLDQDHYGLNKIKERIVEYLAVMKLKEKQAHPIRKDTGRPIHDGGPTILCFIGPPGVGKTSIGKSIARALGRKFVRISLGGVHDEAEIRGHRRTYIGSLPGRIIQGIKEAGSNNPVFMLDEIDKIGSDFRGDPSSALLETLDPEQNDTFSDHYLEVPFDLSKVMFITTGNMLDTVPPALRDRMEVIRFAGYTEEEKFHIAKKYLWAKQLHANGLDRHPVKISDTALYEVIRCYTREAGVRELERNLATICRKIARRIADSPNKAKKSSVPKQIDTSQVRRYLGVKKYTQAMAEKKNDIGTATGLAYTQAGGDILTIEVALMPGKGALILTGKLGKVMQESARAALSYVRSSWNELGLTKDFYKNTDIHIHVPEGAVPKDGPSAGVTMAAALVSAFTRQSTRSDVGMTGEITLRGRVLEIGGVKEKVLAAHRAGLKTVIMPKENKKDLEEIPAKVKKDLKFIFADKLPDVLKVAIESGKKPVTTRRKTPFVTPPPPIVYA